MKNFKVSSTYCQVKFHVVEQFISAGKIIYSTYTSSISDLSWMLECGFLTEESYNDYINKLSALEVIF